MKGVLDWLTKHAKGRAPEPPAHPTPGQALALRQAALDIAPVIWLLGKTGAGKSAIVAELTGADSAEIGNGFEPCTRSAAIYDFPAEQPLLRFLDTRGLGEAGYDPREDMRVNAEQAHLLIVAMRVADPNQRELLEALDEIRRAHPGWPLIVAQTGLHDLYQPTDADHPATYPYRGTADDDAASDAPRALRNALRHQRTLLEKLPGAAPLFVPIDFTRAEEGYTPPNYGRAALLAAILETAPEALKTVARLHFEPRFEHADELPPGVHSTIYYYAAAAAGVGAIPVAGIATVPATQAAMLWALAQRYGVDWDWPSAASLGSMLGTAALARQGAMLAVRQFAKALPWIIPAAAAQDYAVTYALGRAAGVYLAARNEQREPDAEAVKASFREGLARAFGVRDDETRR